MKKMNFYSNGLKAFFALAMMLMTINIQAQVSCIGGSPTSPGANFTFNCANPSMPQVQDIVITQQVCSGTVTVTSLGGTPITTAAALQGYIGKVVIVTASNVVTAGPDGICTGVGAADNVLLAGSCWGYLMIEDKTAPILGTCVPNITLTCAQAASVTDLCVTGQFNGASNAKVCSPLAPTGTVIECSKYEQSYVDAGTINPCTGGTITRTWTLKDIWGNTASPFCVQTITVTAAPAFVAPAALTPVKLQCQDVTAAMKEAILNGTDPNKYTLTGCGLSVDPNPSVRMLQLCGNGMKIIRNWTVIDMCGTPMVKGPVEQIIEIVDETAPEVSVTYQNYSLEADADCAYMNGMSMARVLQKLKLLNAVTADFTTPVKGTKTLTSKPTITLVPRADANVCNMASIFFTLKGADVSCGNGSVTYSSNDSRIRFNGATTATVAGNAVVTVTGTIMKSQGVNFTVIVTDVCGNTNRQDFTVDIKDNVAPQVVCVEETRATLGSDGTVRIYTQTFNNRSSDNCGIESMHVRRATIAENACGGVLGNNPDLCWNDYVNFNCGDLGRTDIMVVLRAVDAAGNYSDCMVNVTVDDKTGPICMRPLDISLLCTDPTLSSYKSLFTTPSAFDNCGIKTTTFADDKELTISCGKGDVTRTWTFTDCANTTTTCTQKLTVTPVYGFTVPRIADETKSCALGANGIDAIMEADRRTILASATLTTANGAKTCSAPIVETEYWKYSSSQYCQIYRIRYTIIDKCDPFYDYNPASLVAGNCGVMYQNGQAGPLAWLGAPNATCTQITSVAFGAASTKHIVVYERFINVNDVTPPTSTIPTAPDACTTYNTPGASGGTQVLNQGCTWSYYNTLNGADNCGTNGTAASDPATVTFMWRLVVKNVTGVTTGAQVAVGNTALLDFRNMLFGTYTLCYRVTDLCGNMSQEYCFDISGKDCKAPEILVHNKIVALGGVPGNATTGMAILKYIDIRNRITDNCAGDLTNDSKIRLEKGGATTAIAPAATATQEVMFTCADLQITPLPASTYASQRDITVRVWAVDNAGNWNYALSTITLQDNDRICATGTVAIFGAARTESNSVVNNVTVSASVNGAAVSSATVANGSYNFTMDQTTNVQVRAAKNNNEDAAQGVTTFDIAKVSQHVLDIEKFASPYQMIAGDVDKSGEIDATDMLHMRRFILKITPSLPGGNFRFIDKAYTFRNAANPFGEDFPEVVNIASLTANTAANFVAVKLGDVNNSYSALAPRSSRTLSFLANDMNVVAGNEYTVNIAADKMDAAAFQGTFSFNGATVKTVKAGSLNNMTDGNFGIFSNAVTTSWNGKTQDASDVLAITFVANKSGKLSDMLTVNSALTQAVANDAAGNEMNVNLKFNTGKVAGGEFALYQNQPNPVANETTIGFNLPKDGQARLTITAVDGKVVKVLNGTYKAGYNTVTVNKSDLNASGVFYYRLETADHSASKKMVIIE